MLLLCLGAGCAAALLCHPPRGFQRLRPQVHPLGAALTQSAALPVFVGAPMGGVRP